MAAIDANAAAFPAATVKLTEYPANELFGNDDRSTEDEDNNPYSAAEIIPGSRTVAGAATTPAIGQIGSLDAPNVGGLNVAAGGIGETAEFHVHFGEFVRVCIGEKWYRISEFKDWRTVISFSHNGTQMQTDSVNMFNNNNDW